MAITGHLAEFSLPEIFQFLEQGHKTGLLTIFALPEPQTPKEARGHYIWFSQGRVVAAANRSDHRGLINIISQRGWLGDRAASRLLQCCGPNTPLGLCLKTQGILQADQLKLLFYTQVMRQVCALFALEDGWFHFDSKANLPLAEMTGLNAPATEVTLAGLRALKDWRMLAEKLPDPMATLISVIEGKPHHRLNQIEWQIWEFTNGNVPLSAIAKQLQLPVLKIQQVAFRLIVVGLIEEVPMVLTPTVPDEPLPTLEDIQPSETQEPSSEQPSQPSSEVSQSFLQNLVTFLKGKS